MTLAQIQAMIDAAIVANGNNEITADVLRPVLNAMAQFVEDLGGQLSSLSTTDKTTLAAAINEVKTIAESLSTGSTALFVGNYPTYAALVADHPTGQNGEFAYLLQDEGEQNGFFEYRWNIVDEEWQKETTADSGSIFMKVSGSPFAGVTSLKFQFDETNFTIEELVGGGIKVSATAVSSGSVKKFYASAYGLPDDADLSLGSTTFGTDGTIHAQALLDEAEKYTGKNNY